MVLTLEYLLLARTVHRDDQTGLFWVASVLHLLLLRVDKCLHVATSVPLVLFHLCSLSFLELLVVTVHFLALLLDLLRDLLVYLQLAVGFLLGLAALCHEHLPAPHVVHSLVLVREQVAFDQWTVTHIDTTTPWFEWVFAPDVRQTDFGCSVLPVLFVLRSQCR